MIGKKQTLDFLTPPSLPSKPILADPLHGHTELTNCDAIRGNIVILTASPDSSFSSLARRAMECEAAAAVVVMVPQTESDDYSDIVGTTDQIFAMDGGPDEDVSDIDIPCIMVSLTSGNMLLTASDDRQHLPDRVRLYAGGDRPFFEDMSHSKPQTYLIHNLILNDEECDYLINLAGEDKLEKYDGARNYLEGTEEVSDSKFELDRAYIWKGFLQSPTMKAIEERIEGVTGFPQIHMSDFRIDRQKENG